MKKPLALFLAVLLAFAPFTAAPAEEAPPGAPEVPDAYAGSALEARGYPFAGCYLLVTVGKAVYILPLLREGDMTVDQGNGVSNTFHVTADSVRMVSSTCENQDCIWEGTVTAENRKTRLLGNMILCLPHQVGLELYTFEEMEALLRASRAAPGTAETP